MKNDKFIQLNLTIKQAIAMHECLRTGITAYQDMLEDQDGNSESWFIAKNNIKQFSAMKRNITSTIDAARK